MEVVTPVLGCACHGARGRDHVCPPWRGNALEFIPHRHLPCTRLVTEGSLRAAPWRQDLFGAKS